MNICGNIISNLGQNVMKLGHNDRFDLPEDKRPPLYTFRRWQIGVFLFVSGSLINFVSFGYAAQSLLAALGSVQFVSNVIFASLVLKEKVTILILLSTTCIIGGSLLLVLFGNHSSETYTVEELLDLYKKPAYVIYLVLMFVGTFGGYILYQHGKRQLRNGNEQSIWVTIMPVMYSLFSSLLGSQTILFAKSISVLLRETFSGQNQFTNWYTYVTFICFFVAVAFWVTRLNKSLGLFDAMIIVPLMQVGWTVFSITEGLIYFEEYQSFTTLSGSMFGLGLLVVFVGVYLLTRNFAISRRQMEEEAEAEALEYGGSKTDDGTYGNGGDKDRGFLNNTLMVGFGVPAYASTMTPRPPGMNRTQHLNGTLLSREGRHGSMGGAGRYHPGPATDRSHAHENEDLGSTMKTDVSSRDGEGHNGMLNSFRRSMRKPGTKMGASVFSIPTLDTFTGRPTMNRTTTLGREETILPASLPPSRFHAATDKPPSSLSIKDGPALNSASEGREMEVSSKQAGKTKLKDSLVRFKGVVSPPQTPKSEGDSKERAIAVSGGGKHSVVTDTIVEEEGEGDVEEEKEARPLPATEPSFRVTKPSLPEPSSLEDLPLYSRGASRQVVGLAGLAVKSSEGNDWIPLGLNRLRHIQQQSESIYLNQSYDLAPSLIPVHVSSSSIPLNQLEGQRELMESQNWQTLRAREADSGFIQQNTERHNQSLQAVSTLHASFPRTLSSVADFDPTMPPNPAPSYPALPSTLPPTLRQVRSGGGGVKTNSYSSLFENGGAENEGPLMTGLSQSTNPLFGAYEIYSQGGNVLRASTEAVPSLPKRGASRGLSSSRAWQ